MEQTETATLTDVIDRYYRYANAGDWDRWCDLFTENTVMDEQLGGHVEGRSTLRDMMKGFPAMYATFQNEPRRVIASGNEGAVVSHISAVNAAGKAIEAEVMNYFRLDGDKIAYMANFHDTKPFTS
jgi:ketosteroid isomerase-like protein